MFWCEAVITDSIKLSFRSDAIRLLALKYQVDENYGMNLP